MITLPDHDAIELAELLDWLAEFLTVAPTTIVEAFNQWASDPTATPNLTQDLQRWANQLRTTTPT
jgi:hypothetical protein